MSHAAANKESVVSDSAETVRVNLGPRSYDIAVGAGTLGQCGAALARLGRVTHAVIITDKNVEQPHAAAVAESLSATIGKVEMVVLEPGEASKSVDNAFGLWNGLLELGADRKTVLVAVGGGVIGDLAGFIAATYARGLRFFQVPTTLLAQVDSSVGGKVGVNLPTAKNMVGAFLQPMGVHIDTATLDTLPRREYVSGLAEVVKYGVILDAEFFAYLEKNCDALMRRDHAVLDRVIARCCRLKADVVEQDEREETGLRAILNYGHTFGHAFESLSGYGTLLHGEAVAMGMECAARLACLQGKIGRDLVDRQRALLTALELPVDPPAIPADEVLAAMAHDKKNDHGRLRLILPTQLGKVALFDDALPEQLRAALTPPTSG